MSPSSTSSSEAGKAAAFLARLALFALPAALALLPGELLLQRSGDAWPVAKVAAAQERDPGALYLRGGLSQQFWIYKAELLHRGRPDLVFLGSSRAWQFRPPVEGRAVNAGGMIQTIRDLEVWSSMVVSGKLPKPRAVLLAVDPWWVRVDHNRMRKGSRRALQDDEAWKPIPHFHAIRELLRGGKVPASWFWNPPREPGRIGLGALASGAGFRADGSFCPGPEILEGFRADPVYRDRQDPPVVERIRGMASQFIETPGLDPDRVELLLESLRRLRGAGVEVTATLLPFSSECAAALDASPGLSRWWRQSCTELPERMAAAGFPCRVLRTPADLGAGDEEMIDGYHPGEVLSNRLLEDLVRRVPAGSWLGGLDAAALAARRARPGGTALELGP